MYRSIAKKILEIFVFLSLFGLFKASSQPENNEDQPSSEVKTQRVSRNPKFLNELSSIGSSKKDTRIYRVDNFNDVELVVVEVPTDSTLILRIVIGWGFLDGGRLRNQLKEFLLGRALRVQEGYEKRNLQCECSSRIYPNYIYYELWMEKRHFKKNLSYFLKWFNTGADVECPGVSVNNIKDKIENGGKASPEELEFFLKNIVLLESKITFLVYGDVTDNMLKDLYAGMAKIRSRPRVIQTKSISCMKSDFIEDIEKLYAADPISGYQTVVVLENEDYIAQNISEIAIAESIVGNKLRERVLKDVKCEIVKISFKTFSYKDLISIGIEVVMKNSTFKDYKRASEILFKSLHTIEISEKEYLKAIEEKRERFEYLSSIYDTKVILDILSVGSLFYRRKNYLNFGYEPGDLKLSEINKILKMLLDTKRWEAIMILGIDTNPCKEVISEVLDLRIHRKRENPRWR